MVGGELLSMDFLMTTCPQIYTSLIALVFTSIPCIYFGVLAGTKKMTVTASQTNLFL